MRPPELFRLRLISVACIAWSLAATGCSSVLNEGLDAPTQSIFGALSPQRVVCQAMPVGLARVHSVPTGPAASPIFRIGRLEVGAAEPDGAIEDVLAADPWSLTSRALRSGARLAGNGLTCGNRLFFYLGFGATASDVSVLR